jgi:predicted ATPase
MSKEPPVKPSHERFQRLRVTNFRALAEVDVKLEPVNVVFGPCGVGKSSLLDIPWFVRDCLLNGVDRAAAGRDHGIGMLWDGADPSATIAIELASDELVYALELGLSGGRIDARPGERLAMVEGPAPNAAASRMLLERAMGADMSRFLVGEALDTAPFPLREPEMPSLTRYVDVAQRSDVERFFELLRAIHSYSSRAFHLHPLKRRGSETSSSTSLEPFARNLWSVLRNLKDRRGRDPRYDTICDFMRQAFPDGFQDLEFEQTAPTAVYASMREHGRRQAIHASGISDGHLQMLIVLTAVFGGDVDHSRLLVFDEPEISLHPWPLAVMAHAFRTAARDWGRQILVATHSPVMISQFESHELLVAEKVEGGMSVRRLDEIAEIQDLLAQFAAGSIYMAQAVAPQGGRPQQLTESEG